ncbi:VOC family protein [Candidatus Neptunochlamydia vexilliferae]|uniref:VOC domain-containing protein n=1 Tax=Candidatus Neptunichlamydia vexilliferae TaxID=1651774 RepID=A0ABS0AZZ4_9BACT|nr:VOC family protein [Candidatus Neptunochlamydia vexilliferae]MBF5059699.1 hypothetical protein [Candidatus Neptunochlamydia vexilliferae]
MTKTAHMNQVVHFEIPADDTERAKKFYDIFGWDIEGKEDYIALRTTPIDKNFMPKNPGAINGGMIKRTDDVKAPVIAIHVESVDTYIEKVVAAGGQLIMPKIEIPNMGYYAYVSDTEGNVLGLWEAAS